MSTGYAEVQALSPAVAATSLDEAACIVRRAVEDAVTAAVPGYWLRRAAVLEWARPRPGDFRGRASDAELAARDQRLARDAQLCREHAELLRGVEPWWLAEVA